MSFDWNEYLELAQDLADGQSIRDLEEARCRAAVSRAYYAAFHLAMIECAKNAQPFIRDRKSSDHR